MGGRGITRHFRAKARNSCHGGPVVTFENVIRMLGVYRSFSKRVLPIYLDSSMVFLFSLSHLIDIRLVIHTISSKDLGRLSPFLPFFQPPTTLSRIY